MKTLKHLLKLTPVAAACALPLAALATNGMNIEGYGLKSTGMGGASQAIDHGTAAMAQNPATPSLWRPARASTLGLRRASARSDARSGARHARRRRQVERRHYVYMPAFGYARAAAR